MALRGKLRPVGQSHQTGFNFILIPSVRTNELSASQEFLAISMYCPLTLAGQGCWHLHFKDVETEAQRVYMNCPKEHRRFEARWSGPALSSGLPHCAAAPSGRARQVTGGPARPSSIVGVLFWPKAHDCKGLKGWWEETLIGGQAEEIGEK